jgi:hypothetical protein
MKITRQGIRDLNTKQTNGKERPTHPLILNEQEHQALALAEQEEVLLRHNHFKEAFKNLKPNK